MALVYHGTDSGASVYYNGVHKKTDTSKEAHGPWGSGNGQIAIGKFYVRSNTGFASVLIDELMLWNVALSQQQLQQLHDMY